jgi:hypothetical protein
MGTRDSLVSETLARGTLAMAESSVTVSLGCGLPRSKSQHTPSVAYAEPPASEANSIAHVSEISARGDEGGLGDSASVQR